MDFSPRLLMEGNTPEAYCTFPPGVSQLFHRPNYVLVWQPPAARAGKRMGEDDSSDNSMIVSGVSPIQAVKYQIAVVFLIASGTARDPRGVSQAASPARPGPNPKSIVRILTDTTGLSGLFLLVGPARLRCHVIPRGSQSTRRSVWHLSSRLI